MGFIFSMRSISSHSTFSTSSHRLFFLPQANFFASLRSKKTKQVAVDGEKTSLFSASPRICYSSHDDVGRMKNLINLRVNEPYVLSAASQAGVCSVSGRTSTFFCARLEFMHSNESRLFMGNLMIFRVSPIWVKSSTRFSCGRFSFRVESFR